MRVDYQLNLFMLPQNLPDLKKKKPSSVAHATLGTREKVTFKTSHIHN